MEQYDNVDKVDMFNFTQNYPKRRLRHDLYKLNMKHTKNPPKDS